VREWPRCARVEVLERIDRTSALGGLAREIRSLRERPVRVER
jgi:hypothetical protein